MALNLVNVSAQVLARFFLVKRIQYIPGALKIFSAVVWYSVMDWVTLGILPGGYKQTNKTNRKLKQYTGMSPCQIPVENLSITRICTLCSWKQSTQAAILTAT